MLEISFLSTQFGFCCKTVLGRGRVWEEEIEEEEEEQEKEKDDDGSGEVGR